MITQIRRWFQKLFAWWRWQDEPMKTYVPTESHPNRGISAEPMPRSPFDGTISQPGIAPQTGNQGDPRCSTIEEWPGSNLAKAPHPVDDDWKREPQPPLLPPASLGESGRENPPVQGEKAVPILPPTPVPASAQASKPPLAPASKPAEEQHLEFLRYLVRRGLVNEGFTEGQVPEQYKKP